MKKRIVFLALVSTFLLSAMVVTSVVAQPRIVGVSVGDWFKYGEVTVNWSSNDPNATFPPPHWEMLEGMNETEWMLLTVGDVSGTNITCQAIEHYKNGTEETESGYIDIDTGDGNMTFLAISANLDAGHTIYGSGNYSTWMINETVSRTYPGGVRETNHINMTMEYSYTLNETQYYYYNSMNFYWDRSSGILVEDYFAGINQTGEYTTTWSAHDRITESSVWVIPEFPAWTSMLLILIVLTVAVVIYKRRILKTPIH